MYVFLRVFVGARRRCCRARVDATPEKGENRGVLIARFKKHSCYN